MRPVYIIMGVSGVGKTTIGKLLGAQLNLAFYDADDFHPQENIDKMASGMSLTDEDRLPWLDVLASRIGEWQQDGAVLACSALKESYRKRLSAQRNGGIVLTTYIYLYASFEDIRERINQRKGHFFDNSLLQSQFDTLEPPTYGIHLNSAMDPHEIIKNIQLQIQKPIQIGLVGLGVMGKSLARNFGRNGARLSLYNRNVPGTEEQVALKFISEHTEIEHAQGFEDIEAFVQSLERPRNIFLMVSAGAVTEAIIAALLPHLDEGDLIMDGGNTHYSDTERRIIELHKRDILFLGIGVSGGERGALEGPSIMPGGSQQGYERVHNILKMIAAKDSGQQNCCSYIGKGGSGHYVKMIHNGIEYAEMQLITEVYDLMRFHMKMSMEAIREQFDTWNAGIHKSYLLEISAQILNHKEASVYLLDVILDKAKQKGTGGWSTSAALNVNQPFDTIVSAVMARNLSALKEERLSAEKAYHRPRISIENLTLEDLQKAYYAARIVNHAIGFETIKAASHSYKWNVNTSELARIWTNGCIIRSSLMELFVEVQKSAKTHTLLEKTCVDILKNNHTAYAKVIAEAALAQASAPVLSAAYNFFNGFVRGDSAAHMIQAQRDFFGAHTYERKDKEGHFHTQWES